MNIAYINTHFMVILKYLLNTNFIACPQFLLQGIKVILVLLSFNWLHFLASLLHISTVHYYFFKACCFFLLFLWKCFVILLVFILFCRICLILKSFRDVSVFVVHEVVFLCLFSPKTTTNTLNDNFLTHFI